MTAKQAGSIFVVLRERGYHAVARFIPRGELAGEHVVEIEPGHDLLSNDFEWLVQFAAARDVELSYGRTTRRVVALS